MTAWRAFTLHGEVYDLTHLHPRRVNVTQPGRNALPPRHYAVHVVFGLHCFTRSSKPGEVVEPDWHYADSRETRVFCLTRWHHSKRLPAIIDNLALRPCYHTGRGNFFVVEFVDETATTRQYEIYFAASRAQERGVVNLYVQSAYVRDDTHANRPRRKPIRLHVILFNTLAGKPIRMPP